MAEAVAVGGTLGSTGSRVAPGDRMGGGGGVWWRQARAGVIRSGTAGAVDRLPGWCNPRFGWAALAARPRRLAPLAQGQQGDHPARSAVCGPPPRQYGRTTRGCSCVYRRPHRRADALEPLRCGDCEGHRRFCQHHRKSHPRGQAPERAEWAITQYRQTNANLRTQLNRIIQRAGLVAWPRLFHNLRATRQTELEEASGTRRACDWLGNSQAVAMGHYIQTTEDHFDSATTQRTVAEPKTDEKAAPNPAPSCTVRPHSGPSNIDQTSEKNRSGDLVTAGAGCGGSGEVTPTGFEPVLPG